MFLLIIRLKGIGIEKYRGDVKGIAIVKLSRGVKGIAMKKKGINM